MCETDGIFITPHFFGFAYCLLQNVVMVEKGIKLTRFIYDSVESDFSPRLIDSRKYFLPSELTPVYLRILTHSTEAWGL